MHLPTRSPSMLSLCMGLEMRVDCPHVLLSMDRPAQGWHPQICGTHTRAQHMQSALACWHFAGLRPRLEELVDAGRGEGDAAIHEREQAGAQRVHVRGAAPAMAGPVTVELSHSEGASVRQHVTSLM